MLNHIKLFAASTLVAAAFCCPIAVAGPAGCRAATQVRPTIVRRLPHDSGAFTQGLLWHDGALFESVGELGRSEVRRVDPKTGRVLARRAVAARQFAEGLARIGGELVQLTWTSGVAHRYDAATLAPKGSFAFRGEGWGLTDLKGSFVRSDGSDTLTFHNANTFAETGRIAVTMDGAPLDELNELETIGRLIYANVWHRDFAVAIDPATGCVVRRIDLSALVAEVGARDEEAVANGIAWDPARRRMFVTGKRWPTMFELKLP